jgi:hypothetical protein
VYVGKLLLLDTASPPNRAALIDERLDLKLRIDAFAATGLKKRADQIDEEIASWYVDKHPDAEFVEKGTRSQLTVSMRANQTTIDVRAAYKILGLKQFLLACSITLKALGELISPAEINALSTSARTGSRRFVFTPLGQPADNVAARPDAVKLAA